MLLHFHYSANQVLAEAKLFRQQHVAGQVAVVLTVSNKATNFLFTHHPSPAVFQNIFVCIFEKKNRKKRLH